MIDLPHDLLQGWDIVVIDDEDDSLMVAQVILDEYGANTHIATNGEEGIACCRNHYQYETSAIKKRNSNDKTGNQ